MAISEWETITDEIVDDQWETIPVVAGDGDWEDIPETSNLMQRMYGGFIKGGMRMGGAIIDLPRHLVQQIKLVPMAVMAQDVLSKKDPQERAARLRDMTLAEEFFDSMTKELGRGPEMHRKGMETIIKNHPEWESEPPESFVDLVTSPDKLAVAITESVPLLLSAGVMIAAGQPNMALTMLYASEGSEAKERALAAGATQEQSDDAYMIYGTVAAALEQMQLKGLMKIGKRAYNRILTRTAQKVARKGSKSLTMDVITVAAQEAVEEMAQGQWGDITANIVYDEPYAELGDVLDARAQEAYIAFATALIPGVGGAVAGKAKRSAQAEVQKDAEKFVADVEKNKKKAPVVEEPTIEDVPEIAPTKPLTTDETKGKQYGLTPIETNERLGEAELRYAELQKIPVNERTHFEKKELAYLARNRKNIDALLNKETQPLEKKMTRKQALALGHSIPEQLGWTEDQRRAFNKSITNQESMKTMKPAQRQMLIQRLMTEAEKAGVEIKGPDASPVAELVVKLEERKQKPALTQRDRRNMTRMRKVFYTMKSKISQYFLHMSRIKRLSRALDNYETDGPFSTHIYRPVKQADTAAAVNFSNVMENAIKTFDDLGIDAVTMFSEVVDIGIKDKLVTAERIGVYALAQNEKTNNHLLSEFTQEEIDTIVESVEANEQEMQVAAEIKTYFEQGWAQLQKIAEDHGIKGMVKEENYITAFVKSKDDVADTEFMEGLLQQFTQAKHIPGQQHTIARKPGARKDLELNIFMIHSRAAKAIERFKVMAPVADGVGNMLKNKDFKTGINNATYGHGSRVLDRWLQDSIRGRAAYDPSQIAAALRWLRTRSVNFVLGMKILVAGKQGLSLLPAAGVHPGMIPQLFANLAHNPFSAGYKTMEAEVYSKSDMMAHRDWDRDLRQVFNQKAIQKMYAGERLSPILMRMTTWMDRHTSTTVWYSAYHLSRKHGMNETESVQFADGVVEDTQPMGKAVDLPSFFRGSELEKNFTIFQNQVNQNGNMLWYDTLGEAKARKITLPMLGYRLLMQQAVPALLLGMVSRGRLPEDWGDVGKDLAFYLMSPYVFVGRFLYNMFIERDWGPTSGFIWETPFTETFKLAGAVMAEDIDPKKVAKAAGRTVGAWTGYPPLQVLQTAEGGWNLATDETNDFRELVWSQYALRGKGKKKDERAKGYYTY